MSAKSNLAIVDKSDVALASGSLAGDNAFESAEDLSLSGGWKAIRAFLAFTLLGLLVVAAGNIVLNPWGYYPHRAFRSVSWLPQQEKVWNFMPKMRSPDVLILGSSRVLVIEPEYIAKKTGLTAFNGGMPAARIEDSIAMLQFAIHDCGFQPKEIILGIDLPAFRPEGLNMNSFIVPELRHYLPYSVQWLGLQELLSATLSYEQLRHTGKSILLHVNGFPPDTEALRADGSITYPERDRMIAEGTFKPELSVSKHTIKADFPPVLDPLRRELFEGVLDVAKAKGIRVRAFITPFQPESLNALRTEPEFERLRALLNGYLNDVASRYSVLTIQDFTEIDRFGGDANAFYDPVHYTPENARRIVNKLYELH